MQEQQRTITVEPIAKKNQINQKQILASKYTPKDQMLANLVMEITSLTMPLLQSPGTCNLSNLRSAAAYKAGAELTRKIDIK